MRGAFFPFALSLFFMGGLGGRRKGYRQLYTLSDGVTGMHAGGWGSERAGVRFISSFSRLVLIDWVGGGKQVPAAHYS